MNAVYLWTNGDTTTSLAQTIEVDRYGCSLFEIHGKLDVTNYSEPYFLCSDVSQDVFVYDTKLPVLRQIKLNSKGFIVNDLTRPIWLNVTRPSISQIRLFICDRHGKIHSFTGKGLYCTLLFIPNKYG